MDPIVSIRNASKTYGRGNQRVEVLHRFTMDVAAGEFLAVMGPSGSGKSTLLNVIGGLDKLDAGEVSVAGTMIDRLSASQLGAWRARHVGFVFQFYHLLPALTARQNVEVPLMLTRVPRAQRRKRVMLALGLMGMADRAEHKPQEMSGGQQQRVAIARALIADPALLICDEPTGDLDRGNADRVLELLVVLSKEHHKTVIMVTHDPLAAAYASRVVKLDKGHMACVAANGTVQHGS
jgi:putative ABC transport system ATP-binding protein